MGGEWMRRLWYLLNRRRLDAALAREMASHRAAMADPRAFGNAARLQEEAREVWGWRWLDDLLQDLRYTVRSLAGHKAFAASVVVTLALGIGAATAVFSLVNGLVLRPLPFAAPDRLVRLDGTSPTELRGPVPMFRAYAERASAFEGVFGYDVAAAFVRDGLTADRMMTVRTAGDFFGVLGVPALSGRTYTPADGPAVAVASEHLWRRRFNGDPAFVGSTLILDQRPVTIVGIMPAAFQFPYGAASLLNGVAAETRTDVWVPFEVPIGPRARLANVTARLKPGVSIPAAQAELDRISIALQAAFPDAQAGRRVRVEALEDTIVAGPARRVVWLLFGAVALLLLLACAGVINLSLARMTFRAREVAVRTALGAGRGRLIRQFVTESLTLSAAGGIAGLAMAWWGTRELVRRAAAHVPRAHELTIDWRVFAFLAGVCIATGLAVGALPALLADRREPHAGFQATARSTMSRAQRRMRDALVVVGVAVAFVLAVGAAMLGRELARLHDTDPGLATANVLTFHLGGRRTADTDPRDFYTIADRVAEVPGVRAAGFTQLLPLQNWGWTSHSADFFVKGRLPVSPSYLIHMRYVTPGYFEASGIPIQRGRGFTAADTDTTMPVILVNETLARRQFGDEEAVGLTTNRGTIVGVVRDFRQATLEEPPFPELFFPIAQNWSQVSDLGMTLVVRTEGPPDALAASVRSAVAAASPGHVIFNVRTMEQVVRASLSTLTLTLTLMAGCAGLALLLALSGTYGVVAYDAAARIKEFAIRLALGAERGHVTRLVVGRAVSLTAAGLVLGSGVVVALTPLLAGLPILIRPPSPATIVPVGGCIALVAILAALPPALRATRVTPTEALRHD